MRPRIHPVAASVALLLCLSILPGYGPSGGWAADIKGVTFPDSIDVDGKTCRLNGLGLRTKIVFNVYIGALYLERPTSEAGEAIASEETKRVVMHFLYSKVRPSQVNDAWEDGFQANAAPQIGKLRSRLDRFKSFFVEEMHEGETISLTYRPGRGTEVQVKGAVKGTIEGADFMQALLAVWLGEKPADKGLKKGMLGLK